MTGTYPNPTIGAGKIQASYMGTGSVTSDAILNGTIVNADLATGSFPNITGIGTIDSLSVSGEVIINSTMEVRGSVSYLPSDFTDIDVSGITKDMLNKKVLLIRGKDVPVTITANPPIAAGSDGQMLVLIGTDDLKCVTFNNDTLDVLQLSAATPFTLGKGDILQLIYVASLGAHGRWIEIGRTDN